jgi:hypothetical protein
MPRIDTFGQRLVRIQNFQVPISKGLRGVRCPERGTPFEICEKTAKVSVRGIFIRPCVPLGSDGSLGRREQNTVPASCSLIKREKQSQACKALICQIVLSGQSPYDPYATPIATPISDNPV